MLKVQAILAGIFAIIILSITIAVLAMNSLDGLGSSTYGESGKIFAQITLLAFSVQVLLLVYLVYFSKTILLKNITNRFKWLHKIHWYVLSIVTICGLPVITSLAKQIYYYDPNNERLYSVMAMIHNEDKRSQAIQELGLMIENDPENYFYYRLRADAKLQNGNMEDALIDLKTAIEKANGQKEDVPYSLYEDIGIIYIQQSETDKAMFHLGTAIDLCKKTYRHFGYCKRSLHLRGKLYFFNKDYPNSTQDFELYLKTPQPKDLIEDADEVLDTHIMLAESYHAMGKQSKSYDILRAFANSLLKEKPTSDHLHAISLIDKKIRELSDNAHSIIKDLIEEGVIMELK